MKGRLFTLLATIAAVSCTSRPASAPTPALAAGVPDRAVRRDIPMTNKIRRAFAAGTRDSSGRPGRNYWQQQVDYTINARLDQATSVITGRETISLKNNSDQPLAAIVFRLDQNYFAPNAARLDLIPQGMEITYGMKVTRIAVNGQTVNLNPPPRR